MATLSLLRFSPFPSLRTLTRPRPSPAVHIPVPIRHAAATAATSLPRPRRPVTTTTMSYRTPVPASERLFSALAYALPFFNSLHYGRFLFARFPSLGLAIEPLLPLVAAYRSVPYASFVAFFALYLGVVRNPAFGRYVRFNAMQAVVLDVFLALPTLVQRVLGTPAGGLGFRLLELGYGAIFAFAAACFLYGVVSCVLGKTPYLPIVASAADRQL
uniref:Protein TIC 20 n=1 Tax=Anthurium amnicola TaxID=1678845 RepID=A0A1D1ZB59_9ARAE